MHLRTQLQSSGANPVRGAKHMTTQRLDLRNAEHREELAQAFGWPAVWERLIKRIERDIETCTHGDARHPSHRLQKELSNARFQLRWHMREDEYEDGAYEAREAYLERLGNDIDPSELD